MHALVSCIHLRCDRNDHTLPKVVTMVDDQGRRTSVPDQGTHAPSKSTRALQDRQGADDGCALYEMIQYDCRLLRDHVACKPVERFFRRSVVPCCARMTDTDGVFGHL